MRRSGGTPHRGRIISVARAIERGIVLIIRIQKIDNKDNKDRRGRISVSRGEKEEEGEEKRGEEVGISQVAATCALFLSSLLPLFNYFSPPFSVLSSSSFFLSLSSLLSFFCHSSEKSKYDSQVPVISNELALEGGPGLGTISFTIQPFQVD